MESPEVVYGDSRKSFGDDGREEFNVEGKRNFKYSGVSGTAVTGFL